MQSVIVKPLIVVGFALLALVHCASAEIALSESLAVEGLVDLYGVYRDAEPQVGASEREALDIDQLSLSFLFESAAYSGQLDVAHEGTDDGRGLLLEQLFVALPFAEGTLTLGQYASMLGFEAFDPMALYQSSTAYDMDLSGDFSVLNQYACGAKYTYATAVNFFGLSVQGGAAEVEVNPLHEPYAESDAMLEIAAAHDWGQGWTSFIGGTHTLGRSDSHTHSINAYVSYEIAAWVFAAEFNHFRAQTGASLSSLANAGAAALAAEETVRQWLLMANYTLTDATSLTLRISQSHHDSQLIAGGHIAADLTKYTLAHTFAYSDQISLVTELSRSDAQAPAGISLTEGILGSARVLFTF
jgi:hypothetical protein